MARNQTATLTLRIEPSVKAVLRAAAREEHRSIANMDEGIILNYYQRNGVPRNESDESESQVGQSE